MVAGSCKRQTKPKEHKFDIYVGPDKNQTNLTFDIIIAIVILLS